ncbi:MAG: XTP/dITP diphosphohydrolase [Parcubacteria bacterium C7867-008]|nr:MAG: XTP/dITP diphosphohydrolase [Parcubacteria bacterium C7867-008]
MSQNTLLYATSNPGKILEMRSILEHLGFEVLSPEDLGCETDVQETGTNLGQNAEIKVRAYARALLGHPALVGKRVFILSDDTGFFIKALGGAPGIFVRRWRDGETRMGDEEIISYAIAQMITLTGEDRTIQARTVLAMTILNEDGTIVEPVMFEGSLDGHVLEQPDQMRIEGFPFASLMFVDSWGLLMGIGEQFPPHEKEDKLNHREQAVVKAVEYLRALG